MPLLRHTPPVHVNVAMQHEHRRGRAIVLTVDVDLLAVVAGRSTGVTVESVIVERCKRDPQIYRYSAQE